jgi:hypothetical protein
MKRDMSYALDGAMSTRNQGQLVSTQRVQTQTMRTPGLVATGDQGGMGKPLPTVGTKPAQGLGAFSLELPLVGTVHWPTLALGVIAGAAVWSLTSARRQAFKQRVASKAAQLAMG